MSFLDKIRKKPEYIRIQILWISVLLIMVVIVSLWIISFNPSYEIEEKGEISESLDEIKKEVPNLKEVFKASIGAFFKEELEDNSNQNEEVVFEKEEKEINLNKLPLTNEETR